MTTTINTPVIHKCRMCDKPVPDYKPEYCCSGHECTCLGLPNEPPICSNECWDKLMNGGNNLAAAK